MSCLFEPIYGRYPPDSICDSYTDCVGCNFSDPYKQPKQTNAEGGNMSEDNFETIKVEPNPLQVGTSCMICDDFIPLGFGYYGSYIPTTRICDGCKKKAEEDSL